MMSLYVLAAGAVGTTATWHKLLVMGTVDVCLIAIIVSMLLCVMRLIRGPHLADRALSVDTFGLMLIGLVLLATIRFETLMFFDGVLVLALLSFAGTVAMAQFIGRPHLRRRSTSPQTREA